METYFNIQEDTKLKIQKARVNFKKSPKERITQSYVETRLESLVAYWTLFRDTHRVIVSEYDSKELMKSSYYTTDAYDVAEELYTDYKTELKAHALKFKNDTKTTALSDPKVNVGSSVGQSSCVRLPKISIPSFSGKYTEWTSFRDLFTSLIHNNKTLDDVQRLHYLKGYLTGEAEQLVRHIPITADNYTVCWDQLYHRYNNKRHLAYCILNRFMSQKNIQSESSSAIKELLDTTNECLNALQNLNISSWDIIIIYIVSLKLDTESRKLWESQVSKINDELPKLSDFKDFLDQRFRSLEFLDNKVNKSNHSARTTKVMHVTSVATCNFCSEDHKLINCKKFAKEDVEARRNFVQTNRLCFNCLGPNHSVFSCRHTTNCRVCRKRHHSLLHPKSVPKSDLNYIDQKEDGTDQTAPSTSQSEAPINVVSCFSNLNSQVLLATALIKVESKTGTFVLRSLLDQGSQASFITESSVQMLGLKKIPNKSVISGLGSDQSATLHSKWFVTVKVQSRHDPNFIVDVKAHVLNKLTSLLPERKIVFKALSPQMTNLNLADPLFGTPNKIDILLGAEVYCQILMEGVIKGLPGFPVAQNTKLGWILSGYIHASRNQNSMQQNKIINMHTQISSDDLLKKFWEIEEPSSECKKMLSEEEQSCEEFFTKTFKRDSSGRYVVRLPFKTSDPKCQYGNSLDISRKRFYLLEKRLLNNPEFRIQYSDVIEEYLALGHMEVVPESEIAKSTAIYLPHHAVVRDDRTTTKVRVVFDASCSLNNGTSLNRDLMVGPTLQPDLRHIIIRWRCYPICLVADIVKMYRQVKMSEEDVDFQRLLWRRDSNSEIQHLRLLRVTFGTSSAPYLAVKALQQLAYDEGDKYPLAANRVLKEFYVDDLMSGCESVEEGIQIYHQMNELLSHGGFKLQKWTCNNDYLLQEIDENKNDKKDNLEMKSDSVMKILGLTWNRLSDEFEYTVQLPSLETPVTKRRVISDIARLFDPLGWIAPVITTAKGFIQRIWLAGVGWDDEIPSVILKDWISYRQDLVHLTGFQLPRWVGTGRDDVHMELQGFSDASNAAYAAVVYVRTVNSNGEVHVNLVASKSRIAPVKQVSIPRLELCGAVLLAKLLHEISEVLDIPRVDVHAWTDSSVVLAWLSSHPSKWKTFVANRVSEILTITDSSQWSHVKSEDNPADCASRGINPSDISKIEIWKNGPKWLQENTVHYSKGKFKKTDQEEKKSKVVCHITIEGIDIISRFSSLKRLIRVIAYCKRFLNKTNTESKTTRWLTSKEINESLLTCIRLCQREGFLKEIESLQALGKVNKNSKLTSLNPFLDGEGILRVGGRLQKSNVVEDMKHPILIPYKSHLTNLIVADAHERTIHGGPQLMLNYLRTQYWIVNAKSLVRQHVRKCIVCVRHSAQTNQQLMGQLPSARVTACRPFHQSSVDYAGPIAIRPSKGRGYHSTKGYICLFICMATRAIHLEVVSDLTSEAFLAAFKRFVARRGHCADLWSDNGTNFVGANRELKNLLYQEGSVVASDIASWLATNGTNWHFIPPHSPNFGGLWEAGVKSTKHHLKRVIANSTLTFEEMTTLLCQIEACLNSRPITQISSNPEDPYPLTPGHFLVGEPLVLVPDSNYENVNMGTLKRWHFAQRLVQEFWRRWSQEYLTQLQHRYKWSHITPEPKVGDIVLVKEDDLPPARWLYGIITDKHIGVDNLTRVVSLKCKDSVIKRPVSKLIILPVTA